MKDYFKLLKRELSQNLGIGILAFILFVFARLIPFVSEMKSAIDSNFIDNTYSISETVVKYLGSDNFGHKALSVVLGCVFGIVVCFWLHGRKQTDFYGSLPCKKTTVFAAKYSSFIVIFAAACALNLVLMFMACKGIRMRAFTYEAAAAGLLGLLDGTAGFCLIYSAVVLAGLLTGCLLAHIAMTAVIMFTVPFGALLAKGWYDLFFLTHIGIFFEKYYTVSPIVFFCSCQGAGGILVMTAVFAAFTALNFFVCIKRKAEAAGSVLIFRGELLRVFLSLLCASAGGLSAASLFVFNEENAFTVGFFVVLVISSCIIEIIFRTDFTAVFKNKRWLGAAVLIGAVMVIYSRSDLFDTYVPAQGLVKSAAFYIDEIHLDEYIAESRGGGRYNSLQGPNSLVNREAYINHIFKNMKIKDAALVCKVLESLTENCGNYDRWHDDDGSFTVYVKTRLKSGRSYKRKYTVRLDDCEDVIGELFASEEYKNSLYESFINLEKEDIRSVYIDNYRNFDTLQDLNITPAQWERLYDALREEAKDITFNQVINEAPVCKASFYTKELDESGKVPNIGYRGAEMYVYPSCEKTLEILKEIGMTDYSGDELSDFVTLIKTSDGAEYTEKEDIKKILPYINVYTGLYRMKLLHENVLDRYGEVYVNGEGLGHVVYLKDGVTESGIFEGGG